MPVATVHGDVVFAVGHVKGHALVPFQSVAYLIEIANGQVGTDFYRAHIGGQLAQQNAQQGGFSYAVVANNADAITAHDFELKVVEQRLTFIAVCDGASLDHFSARFFARSNLYLGLALLGEALGALVAHGLQSPYTAFVACAPSLDALPNPGFFLSQSFVEQGVASFFFL